MARGRAPRVLLVRYRSLGDMILTIPAVEALGTTYPSARIEYVADDHLAPLLEHNPYLSRIHAYPRSRFRGLPSLRRVYEEVGFALRIARRDYDLVIDFHGNPRAAWLTFMTGAQTRIGFRHVRVRHYAYTRKVSLGREGEKQSAFHHLALARAAGARTPESPRPRVFLTPEEKRAAREALGGLSGGPFIAIHPGANSAARRWPPERFAGFAKWAEDEYSLPSVILAGPGETEVGPRIASLCGAKLLTDRSVRELAARTAEAAAFIGNDSGPMHLAGALGVPLVAVFGPHTTARWWPIGSPSRFVKPSRAGQSAVVAPLEQVKEAFAELAREVGLA